MVEQRRNIRRVLGVAVTAALIAAGQPPAAAQVDFIDEEIENGTYIGSLHITGGFTFPLDGIGDASFVADIHGDAELIAADGNVSGSWSYEGTGSGSGGGAGVTFSSESTNIGMGTFTGTTTAARLVGTDDVTSTASFLGAGNTTSEVQPIDEPLSNVLAGCSQVVATFTPQLNAELEAEIPNSDVFFEGVVVLYDGIEISEAEELARRAAELGASQEETVNKLISARQLLSEVEQLQGELAAGSECPATKEYFNLLTNVAASLIEDVLAELEAARATDPEGTAWLTSVFLPDLVRLGVSTGAMGSGAVSGRGTALMGAAKSAAMNAGEVLLNGEGDLFLGIGRLAALSVQMGWDLQFGGVSDADLDVVLGEDS